MSFLLHKLVKLFESCKQLYNTIQYFIDTPQVGLFSDNATNTEKPRRISFSDFDTAIFVAVEPSA